MANDTKPKSDTPKTLHVFLCYSSGDKPAVRELHQRLCAEGIDAWLDEEKLLPGQDWQREIPKAVHASDVVIVCLSRGSITKAGYIQREIKFALDVADEQPEGEIFLIPAKLEQCEVPDRLSRWQWVNLYEAKGYERLMRALRTRAEALGISLSPVQAQPAHTPHPVEPVSREQPDRAELRQKLAEHFNKEELRTLCFDLGIEHENLPDAKDGMARELVAYCERQGRIPDLVAACQRLRPKVVWDTRATLVVAQPAAQAGTATRAVPTIRKLGGIEFVLVPKGKFIMGSKDDNKLAYPDEKPQHTVKIPYDYWVGRYLATNNQFAAFVEVTHHVTVAEKGGGWSPEKKEYIKGFDWQHPLGPECDLESKGNHPVVQISWNDAMEYCQWLNLKLQGELGNLALRLPTEAEWEKAARGEYGDEWPWGNEFDPAKCNSIKGGKGGTTPVGVYSPQGDSPYGATDMVGNVWEWCHSLFLPYPYKADEEREKESGSESRVVRGGAWDSNQRYARCACRHRDLRPDDRRDRLGFRVVVAPKLS
jgi:formylglycine-generating enzyme required for sulfatase activity